MKTVELMPTAKISVQKNVLKRYTVDNQNSYFLKDGTEFEIELFNPLQETILAKIAFGDELDYNEGLVLRPGERVFLERYLDNNNKMKYVCYTVDNIEESKLAIRNNGLIKVSFYKEQSYYIPDYSLGINLYNPRITYSEWPYGNYNPTSITTTSSPNTYTANNTLQSAVKIDSCKNILNNQNMEIPNKTEIIKTGLIEKGSKSDQNFSFDNRSFTMIPFYSTSFQIYPDSTRIKTSQDLKYKSYCSQCGKKVKYKDKYCSSCGTKL